MDSGGGCPDGGDRRPHAGGGDPQRAEIRVEGLGKAFGRRDVLRDVSFTVARGGFLTLFGPNGAGKTTTLRLVATLLRPSSGSVSVAGHDLKDDPMPVRRAIGFISHNPLLYRDLTAQENLRFYADMYGVADAGRRIGDLLERVELSHRRYDVVSTFSKGMCSVSPSPGRCCTSPGCCCSTNLTRGSTRTRSTFSTACSTRSAPSTPSSWRPTTCARASSSPIR